MAEVDPENDSIRRYVVSHFRYDPSRRERRNVVVAAFDNNTEFEACLRREAEALSDRKTAGEVTDQREHISGTIHDAGHRRRQQNARILHRAIRRGVIPPNLDALELPRNVAIMRPRSRDGFTYWWLTAASRQRQAIGVKMRAWLRRRDKEIGMADESCLFCRILAGDVQAEAVLENDSVLAFRDISPQAPVHVLVIPKSHHPTLADLAEANPDSAVAVLTAARQVAQQEGVGDGYRLVANNGAAAQQTVFHAHVHVLGGRDLTWPPG